MKKLFLIIFIMCWVLPAPLFADYVDDKLPDGTSAQIKDGARQIIELGVKRRHIVKVTKRMIEHNFEDNQIVAAHNVLTGALKKGLPEDPLMDRLKEGIAKGVRPDQIIQAIEKVRVRYETASRYAKRLSDDEDHIEAITEEIAECMAAGIDAGDIDQVAEALKKKSESMKKKKAEALNKRAIRTMKTMARSGVQSQDALSVVESAFRSGFDAEDMQGLEDSFKLNARWSSSVSDLAKAYSVAIENGATFNDVDFYDPWTTSFGFRVPEGGSGMPSGGIPPGGGPIGGSPPGSRGGGTPPPGAPNGAPPAGGGPGGPPPGR
jgi:hypothetical protein